MNQQSRRQIARRDARSIASRRRAMLLERSRRLERLATEVITALADRDAAVASTELRLPLTIRRASLTTSLACAGTPVVPRLTARHKLKHPFNSRDIFRLQAQ
mgnify:CR=1 FL=1